ncbi:MAG: TrkH family potassium uptake protein [Candidatus Aminicenantes bacterium]|nr:TrkH family potassium uptake protein [Candidatus Aminicenantes bacterium]
MSFAGAILAGTLLLTLPFCSASGRLSFIDALFTSTSAICVTGLVVVDTATHFTLPGQIIILVLIQLGGLGIMTFSTMVLLAAGRSITINDRILVQEGYHPGSPRSFKALIKNIFMFTAIIEGAGFVLLFLRFLQDHPWPRALFSGLFHSVSGFCNAGFSVYSNSLMGFRGDVFINLVMAHLIILGGLGFLVIGEVVKAGSGLIKGTKRKLSLHSKMVLTSTTILISGSFFIFLALEKDQALRSFSWKDKILASFFQVVTPRTAGFNTMDLTTLGTAAVLLLMLLMFIGASPGSTGGGVKTSTFGVVLAFIRSKVAARDSTHLFYRTIPQDNVVRAFTLISLSLSVIFIAGFVVLINQPGMLMRDVFFEVFSGFGTVGLSLGITPQLSAPSKVMIILLMYAGRIGPLTLLLAFSRRRALGKYEYIEERVLIG